MKSNGLFDEFQKNVQELIKKSPVADIEKNVKSFMAQGFSKMDLVTREEFDEQLFIVNRLRERVQALEEKVALLEKSKELSN